MKTTRLLASAKFFYATLVVFTAQAVWVALSGRYSMAYDENTHLGIIRLYAERLSPFWTEQPAGPAALGAVSRDPSFLFHYLLSFPYRLIELAARTEMAQVISLRLMCVLFFVLGIIVWRKVLLQTKASKAMVHAVLAIFALTPIVPFLAGQLNYDSLIFLLTALAALLALRLSRQFKDRRQISLASLLLLLTICILGSLVKYAFLPIFMAVVLWFGWQFWRFAKQRGWPALGKIFRKAWQQTGRWARVGLIGLVLLSAGLFVERYGLNTIRYGTPIPECNQVLDVQRCDAYGPWRRNYLTHLDKVAGKLPAEPSDPISYTVKHWLRLMSYQLLFSLNGAIDSFKIGKPLTLPLAMAAVLGPLAVLLFIIYQRFLRRHYVLNFLLLATGIYLLMLWSQEYLDFRHVGIPVAIQGRYLVPFLPFMYLLAGLAYARALRNRPQFKAALVWSILGILLLQGGGVMVFIVRGNEFWYWPHATVQSINQAAQNFLKLFVIGS